MRDYPRRTIDGVEWVRVCRSVDVTARRGFRVNLDIEFDLALFRVNGVVHCVTNICPHKREAAIFDGFIDDGTVTCPMHAWRFDICTGKNVGVGGGLTTYPAREESDWIWVSLH